MIRVIRVVRVFRVIRVIKDTSISLCSVQTKETKLHDEEASVQPTKVVRLQKVNLSLILGCRAQSEHCVRHLCTSVRARDIIRVIRVIRATRIIRVIRDTAMPIAENMPLNTVYKIGTGSGMAS